MKVTVVGAGNVGATVAECVARKDMANEVVLIDIQEGVAQGKALDLWESAPIHGFDTKLTGGSDYALTEGSDICVITAGLPRKPGMSRDDLLATELSVSVKDIQAMLLGGHGDTMVPLPRYTTVAGTPVTDLLPESRINEIVERTKKGGGEIVGLMGTSAWYAPGAAAAEMVEAIIKDSNRVLPAAAWTTGQFGCDGMFIGVPVKLGREGVKEIIEIELDADEQKLMDESAQHVRDNVENLERIEANA